VLIARFYLNKCETDDNGKLIIESYALEQCHRTANPMPDVAGLDIVLGTWLTLGAGAPEEKVLSDGKQWHSLVWLDCFWFHTDPEKPIPPPRFFDAELHDYLYTRHRNGGGVTLNIGIYRDGSLAEASLEQVRRMGEWMKEGRKPAALHRERRLYG